MSDLVVTASSRLASRRNCHFSIVNFHLSLDGIAQGTSRSRRRAVGVSPPVLAICTSVASLSPLAPASDLATPKTVVAGERANAHRSPGSLCVRVFGGGR